MHLLRGREAILRSKSILDDLARMSDQPGASDDLTYRLSTPYAEKNPCLVLVGENSVMGDTGRSAGGVIGAMLLFEYRMLGLGLRLYTTGDTTGRRTVIAPTAYRARVAAQACKLLLAQGAQIVVTSIQLPVEDPSTRVTLKHELSGDISAGVRESGTWSLVERKNPLYLPLASTFDETLSTIGKKTRTNLRYYRRRAEKQLGCRFVPEVAIGLDEFVAFNRACTYAVTDEVARWRFESLATIERPFLQGVCDRDGHWLSLASGRRSGDHVDLEWQCNRANLPAASLSTVMRAYLIEHEISLGMKRLYFEGGTPSSLQQSFVVEGAADLTLCRRSAYVWLIRKMARRLFPPKNQMAQILTDKSLLWTKF